MKRLAILPIAATIAASPAAAGDRSLERTVSDIHEQTAELNAPVELRSLSEEENAALQQIVDEQVDFAGQFNKGPVKHEVRAEGIDEKTGATYILTMTADYARRAEDIRDREPDWQPVTLDIFLPETNPNEQGTNYDVRIVDYEPRGLDFELQRYAGANVSDAVWTYNDGEHVFNGYQPPTQEETIDFLTVQYEHGLETVLQQLTDAVEQRDFVMHTNRDDVKNRVAEEREEAVKNELGRIKDAFPYDVERE